MPSDPHTVYVGIPDQVFKAIWARLLHSYDFPIVSYFDVGDRTMHSVLIEALLARSRQPLHGSFEVTFDALADVGFCIG